MVALWLNPPLAPVTVIVYVPLLVLEGTLIVTVDVPVVKVVIVAELSVAVNPPPDVVAARLTVPENPFKAVTVMVEVP